jgi:hypothetical protein
VFWYDILENGGRRTEDGRRRTEDGRRRTEGGGRKAEDGRAENSPKINPDRAEANQFDRGFDVFERNGLILDLCHIPQDVSIISTSSEGA